MNEKILKNLLVVAFAALVLACQDETGKSGDSASVSPASIDPVAAESPPEAQTLMMSPAAWPDAERQAYLAAVAGTELAEALRDAGLPPVSRSGAHGLVASTFSAFAVRSGVAALESGGNAMDAALTTAITHATLHMGGASSHAGQAGIMYYEKATGRAHNLNASYASVRGESDPMSIPSYGNPSGRAVLVPGFIAGVAAAHERFGQLAFADLFESSIYLAEEGFTLSPFWAGYLVQREHVLTRRPEGRTQFLNEDGQLLPAGSQVRQPALAGFLRQVSMHGAAYMYEGPWAEKFVEAVRGEGGHMTLQDLAAYQPVWSEMGFQDFLGYQVYASPPLMQKIEMAHLAGLSQLGHYSESPEALYQLIRISRISDILPPHGHTEGLSAAQVTEFLPELDLSIDKRYSSATTQAIWQAMNLPQWSTLESMAKKKHMEQAEAIAKLTRDFAPRKVEKKESEGKGMPNHTAGVVAIDAEGNMAVINHSVTSAVWGELGIFVEGVSVTDPGAFAQRQLAKLEPGEILGSGVRGGTGACPALVVKNGEAVYGCGNVGAAYDLVALQGLVNFLEYGIRIEELGDYPMFRKNWPPGPPVRQPANDGFSAEVIEAVKAMGIAIEQTDGDPTPSLGGNLVAAGVDDATSRRVGTVTRGDLSRRDLNGRVRAE